MKGIFGVATAAALASAATTSSATGNLIPATSGEASVPAETSPASLLAAHLAHQKGFTFEYISSDQDDIEVDVSISSSDSGDDDEPEIPASVVYSHGDSTSLLASSTSYTTSATNASVVIGATPLSKADLIKDVQMANAYDGNGYYGGYGPGAYPYGYNPHQYSPFAPPAYRATAQPTPRQSVLRPFVTASPPSIPTQPSLRGPQPPLPTSGTPDYYRGYNDGWASAQKNAGSTNGLDNRESEGYISGFTAGFRAAQTGTKSEAFKEAYLEGESQGYLSGYYDGEQHKSYVTQQTHVPIVGPAATETSSEFLDTTFAPRASFTLSYESRSTSSASLVYSTSGLASSIAPPSSITESSEPLTTISRIGTPLYSPYAGYPNPYGGYGYGYGYGYPAAVPDSRLNTQEDTKAEAAPSGASEATESGDEVQLNKRGILSDMFQGNRAKRRPVTEVNYAPPSLQVAPPAPVYQYSQVQACQQPYQIQAVQPRINDVYSSGGYNAPQYVPASYGYGYGGYSGNSLPEEANGLFSGAMQCMMSLLNPETYCPGIFGGDTGYQQQPYYYQPQPYYQPVYQPTYQSTYQQQPQLLTSYAVPRSQYYYVLPNCGDSAEDPGAEPEYPSPDQQQPSDSSPLYSAPAQAPPAQSSPPDNSGINSGDTTKLLNDQLLAQVIDQARQRQAIAQVENELKSAQSLLAEQYQRLSAPPAQTYQLSANQYQQHAPYEQTWNQPAQAIEQGQALPAAAQNVQSSGSTQQNQAGGEPAKATANKIKKPQISVGGSERLNVFPPYAMKSSS